MKTIRITYIIATITLIFVILYFTINNDRLIRTIKRQDELIEKLNQELTDCLFNNPKNVFELPKEDIVILRGSFDKTNWYIIDTIVYYYVTYDKLISYH